MPGLTADRGDYANGGEKDAKIEIRISASEKASWQRFADEKYKSLSHLIRDVFRDYVRETSRLTSGQKRSSGVRT